ncbi:MAG: hypothetical protein AB7W16_15905 [Candidatus Obscuribacterales bacterium]
MFLHRTRKVSSRSRSGRLDIVIIAVVSLLIVAGLIYVIFQIIGHSEQHVDAVRKTRVNYDESLDWRPDAKLSEQRIRDDLARHPSQKKADYSELEVNENCMKLIGRMSRLQELKMTRATIKDPWLRYLAPLPLRSLGLHGTPLTDKGVPYLLKLQCLTHLIIGDTDVTDDGLELLSQSPTISNLEINLGRCITNNGIKHLGKMTRLTILDIGNSPKIDGRCLRYLKDLQNLSHLNIEAIPVKPEDLRALSDLPLVALDLGNSRITDACVPELAKIKTLNILSLTGSDFSGESIAELARLKNLRHLSLKNCPNVNEKSVQKLQAMMPNCNVKYSQMTALSEKMERAEMKQEVQFLESEVKKEMDKYKKPDD